MRDISAGRLILTQLLKTVFLGISSYQKYFFKLKMSLHGDGSDNDFFFGPNTTAEERRISLEIHKFHKMEAAKSWAKETDSNVVVRNLFVTSTEYLVCTYLECFCLAIFSIMIMSIKF